MSVQQGNMLYTSQSEITTFDARIASDVDGSGRGLTQGAFNVVTFAGN